MLRRSLVCFCLLVSALTGCSVSGLSCTSSTYFGVITVDVVDQLNQRVEGATLTITNLPTGNEMTENRKFNLDLPIGTYHIGDDNSMRHVSKQGTPVRLSSRKHT